MFTWFTCFDIYRYRLHYIVLSGLSFSRSKGLYAYALDRKKPCSHAEFSLVLLRLLSCTSSWHEEDEDDDEESVKSYLLVLHISYDIFIHFSYLFTCSLLR